MRRAMSAPRLALAVLAAGAGVGLVSPAVSLAAPVDHVAVAVSSRSPGVGATFTVTAVAKTASGQTDKSFSGPATWSDKSGHLTPGSPSDFVDGVSTTTGVAVSAPYHADTITVMSNSLSGSSGAFNVIGPLAHFSFSPELHQVNINTSFTVKMYARDAAGNLLTGYTGSPTWDDSSGSLFPRPAAFIGGVSTTTTAQVQSPYHLDKITVSDSTAGVQSSSNAFDVVGPFDHFSFSKIPQPLAVDQPFTLVVRAVDAAGNIVTSYAGSPGWDDYSGTLSPSAPAAFVNGVSVNRCTTLGSTQEYDLIAVYDNSAGVDSTSPDFDVTDSQDFTTPGTYTVTVPCAASIGVQAIGAAGGSVKSPCGGSSATGGEGASMSAGLTVSAGEQLTAGVGGAGGDVTYTSGSCAVGGAGGTGSGDNGGAGGSGSNNSFSGVGGGGGGGASFLSTGTGRPTTSSLLLLAGGGGGGTYYTGGNADSAGVPQPPNCPNTNEGISCGGGAGSSPGGKGGAADGDIYSIDKGGSNGGFLASGNGGGGFDGGGGGGGGYYGGGGGGAAILTPGSGGGGQSFISSSVTGGGSPTPTSNPAEVSITYAPPT